MNKKQHNWRSTSVSPHMICLRCGKTSDYPNVMCTECDSFLVQEPSSEFIQRAEDNILDAKRDLANMAAGLYFKTDRYIEPGQVPDDRRLYDRAVESVKIAKSIWAEVDRVFESPCDSLETNKAAYHDLDDEYKALEKLRVMIVSRMAELETTRLGGR